MSILKIKNFTIGNHEPMTLMGGVNVLESESVVMSVAEKFAETTSSLKINWIFKGSFDKIYPTSKGMDCYLSDATIVKTQRLINATGLQAGRLTQCIEGFPKDKIIS